MKISNSDKKLNQEQNIEKEKQLIKDKKERERRIKVIKHNKIIMKSINELRERRLKLNVKCSTCLFVDKLMGDFYVEKCCLNGMAVQGMKDHLPYIENNQMDINIYEYRNCDNWKPNEKLQKFMGENGYVVNMKNLEIKKKEID